MTKLSLSRALMLAGLVAAAGVAQAQTYDVPQQAGEASTMTSGAPNQLTTNSPYGDNTVVIDTSVMGAAPATHVVTTTTYSGPVVTYQTPMLPHHYSAYTLPAPIVNNADTVITGVYSPDVVSRTQAAATFDVPARAGEASTMTGGAPNMVTDNRIVLGNSGYTTVTPPYLLH